MRAVARVLPVLVAVLVAWGVYAFQPQNNQDPKAFPTPVTVITVVAEVVVTRTPDPADAVVVYVTTTPVPTAIAPTPTPIINVANLLEQYGDEQYASLEAMPADLRHYYSSNLNEIASFFKVQPSDMMAVLQAQNEGMLVLQNERPGGIIGISPSAWNGWAYPLQDRYISDVRLIAQHDGLGFDWRQRAMWTQWVEGRGDSSNLNGAEAEPADLLDSMATAANYLARVGVTAEAASESPEGAEQRLAEAIALLQTGMVDPLPPLAEEGQPVTLSEVLQTAFNRQLDLTWGVQFSAAELAQTVDRSPVAAQVAAGTITPEAGAEALVAQFTEYYLAQNERLATQGLPIRWPFIRDEETLQIQLYAVQLLGHTLTPWEVQEIARTGSSDRATIESRISGRTDARVFMGAKNRLDDGLQRSAQGVPISNREVAQLVQPVLQHRTLTRSSTVATQELLDSIEYQIRALPEFQAQNGKLFFLSNPLSPWPQSIGLRFGAPADYQPGGRHTGIDVRGLRDAGKQPMLYAVDDGVVAHMGPLYCLGRGVCRGAYAIVLDHGNNVYSIYSHNSEAFVATGDTVTAGQAIGRQGSEGYSRGSHLHFEIHVGAPYTGVWQEPFRGGEFINPLPWLPRDMETLLVGGE
jgi:murein DD-endopeptidase MepM/ murein hydrolase activator NlpD